MNSKRKKRLTKISFLLPGLILLMNGIVAFNQGKSIFGVIQILASILNLMMLSKFKNGRTKQIFEYGIFIMNIVIATFIAIDYFETGATYIQYVWIFIAVLYTIVFIFKIVKGKTKAYYEV